jgi:hypothetical protein
MLLLAIPLVSVLSAGTVTLVDTIPSGNLFLQPPLITDGGSAFGRTGPGNFVAEGFIAPTDATISQIGVAVEYAFLPGITGTSPMELTLFTDSGNLPGAAIESWTVPLDPNDTSLTLVTVNSVTNALLLAGQQYWLAEVPTDASGTAIGWGLASAGYPGIQLPQAFGVPGSNVWSGGSENLATEFSVLGTTVPEPATFATGALLILSILAARRKASKTS